MQAGRNISINLTMDGSQFTVQVKNAESVLRELRQNLQTTASATDAVGKKFSGMGASLFYTVHQVQALRYAMIDIKDVFLTLPMAILKTSGEFERMTKLMEGLSTAADKATDANKGRDFIFGLAQKAPYEVKTLTDAFVKLKSGGIDPMDGSLQALTDSVARFGGSSDQLHRASIAIQQMGGKGVISMEELRQQLGEAVPDAINMMAIGVGKSMKDLTKAISNGEVESRSALDRMFAVMAVQNYGAAEQMMNTWNGMIERLKTKWELFKYAVGGGENGDGAFAEARKEIEGLLGAFDGGTSRKLGADLSEAMYEIAHAVRGLIDGIIKYYDTIKELGEIVILAWGGGKLYALLAGAKAQYAQMAAVYRAGAATYVAAEREKVESALNALAFEKSMAQSRIATMEQEVIARQKQVVALNVLHGESVAFQLAAQKIADTGRLNGKFISTEARIAAGQLALVHLEGAKAVAIEGGALHSQNQVMRENIIATQALIVEKERLIAAQAAAGTGAAGMGAKMAGMGGILTALGGWMTAATIAIMAGVWAWDKYGNAAEKNAEMARRAANKMSEAADLVRINDNISSLEKDKSITLSSGKGIFGIDAKTTFGADTKEYKDALTKAKQLRDQIQGNLNEASISDFVRSETRTSEVKVAKRIELLTKERDAINLAQRAAEKAIDDDAKLSAKQRQEKTEKLKNDFAPKIRAIGAKLHGEQSKFQGEEMDRVAALRNEEKDGLMRSALQAQWDKHKELKDTADLALEKNKKIGTDYVHVKGKDDKGGGPLVSGMTKHLDAVAEELTVALVKQEAILQQITGADAIALEIQAKYKKLLDDGKLTNLVKDEKGKAHQKPIDLNNKKDKDAYDQLIAGDILAQKLKLSNSSLKAETEALTKETEEFNYKVENSGEFAEFTNKKIQALSAEYAKMKASLKGIDTTELDKKFAARTVIEASSAAFDYQQRVKEEGLKVEADTTTDVQQKIRSEYALTSRKIDAEYTRRIADMARTADLEKLSEEAKQEKLLGIARTYEEQKAIALKKLQFNAKTQVERLGEQWANTTENMNQATAKWANSFMDFLSDLTTTGKADWRKMVVSMLADFSKMMLQKSFGDMITNAFKGVGELGKNLLSSGGNGVSGIFSGFVDSIKKFAGSLFGASDATADMTKQMGETAAKTIADALGITTKITAEQAATLSLTALAAAAMKATVALGGASVGGSGVGGFLSGMIGGSGGSGLSAEAGDVSLMFANGGIMSEFGSIPLRKYASGGIANSAQHAIFGEGSMPEAYVPLPDGRSIPVTVKGKQSAGTEQNVVINITVNEGDGAGETKTSSSGDASGVWGKMAERVRGIVQQEIATQLRPGGVLAR